MRDTIIYWVNTLGQVQPNDLEFIDCKKRSIGKLGVIGVDAGETEAPHIELVEPETDIDPISTGA